MEFSEPSLISDIKAGKESAYRALFDLYYPYLVIYASKFLHSKEAAREAAQDVIVHLFEKRDTLEIRSIKPYLTKSVYHKCLEMLRSRKTFLEPHESDSVEHSDKLEEAEREAEIWKEIDSLPEKCRQIFVMNRFEGLSNQQIADALSLSKRTVETQISNALKTLREALLMLLIFCK